MRARSGDPDVTTADVVNGDLVSTFLPELGERFIGLAWSQSGQAADQNEDLTNLLGAMRISMLGIFVMMASFTRSYVLPLVILTTVAYGVVGAGARQLERDIQDVGLIAVGSSDCPVNQVQVVIANGRTENIIGFAFFLRGFRRNFSQHVAHESHRTDRIVPAGGSWSSCWDVEDILELPLEQKSTLRWEAEFTRIDFAE